MAELNAPIIAKASATAGEVPLASDLEVAEIAVNTADGKLFTKHTDDSIKEISDSGGGGAVDSVNGETGVVSLGIQDMDDFSATATSVEVDLGNWSSNVSGDYPDQGGEWRNYDAATNDVWQIYKEDIFGDDYSTELLALVTGDVIQVSTDSGSTYSISVTLTADAVYSAGGGGNTVIDIVLSDTDGAKLSGLTALNLRITQPGPDAPLVEGDILQWDNAEQKFKPAQAKERIQDMDDFELNLDPSGFSPSSSTGRWATFLTSHSQSGGIYTFPTSGQWRMYKTADTSEGVLQAGDPDSDSQDMAYWDSLDDTPGLMIRFEVDGVTYGPVNVTDAFFASSTGVAVMKWDSSEFDPSTTSWGYVADADGPPVTTEAREVNVVIGYADPTVTFPLADGDVLQWDDADQEFKPAQLPAAPVDSVNGETGVVSLGIQDMDDFSLAPATGAPSYDTAAGTSPSGSGEYQKESSSVIRISPVSADGTDYTTELQNHTGTIWYLVDGVDLYSSTYLGWSSTYGRVDVSAGGDPSTRSSYQIFFTDPGAPPYSTPLVEGDVLQWDNADQKFKPAQLPGAAPVDSVNGETGVVSLGVQDMDDFGLDSSLSDASFTSRVQTLAELVSGSEARYFNPVTGVPYLQWKENSHPQDLDLLAAGDTVTITASGLTPFTVEVDAFNVLGNGTTSIYFVDPWPQQWLDVSFGAIDITVSSTAFSSYVPLAEGDILQWNNAEQKFKPTSDYVSLTTLKTEVAASTDFADFQSRIAAL